MKVQLDEELQQGKKELAEQFARNSPLKEATQLLLGESQEDARILRHMGANSTLMQLEEMTGKTVMLEKLEKEYGEVFKVEQIQALAIKYRLRMLNSRMFIGKMDVQVTAKIKQFGKDTNTSLNEHDLQSRFFVLATPNSFSLEKVSVPRFEKAAQRRMQRRIDMDPVLFYKIDDDHYRMIHKWGNDFTILRLLYGYKWQNAGTVRTFNFFFQLPFIALLFALVFPTMAIMHPIITMMIMFAASGLVAWIRNTALLSEGGHLSEDKTEYMEDLFTPTNWNSSKKLVRQS